MLRIRVLGVREKWSFDLRWCHKGPSESMNSLVVVPTDPECVDAIHMLAPVVIPTVTSLPIDRRLLW